MSFPRLGTEHCYVCSFVCCNEGIEQLCKWRERRKKRGKERGHRIALCISVFFSLLPPPPTTQKGLYKRLISTSLYLRFRVRHVLSTTWCSSNNPSRFNKVWHINLQWHMVLLIYSFQLQIIYPTRRRINKWRRRSLWKPVNINMKQNTHLYVFITHTSTLLYAHQHTQITMTWKDEQNQVEKKKMTRGIFLSFFLPLACLLQ